MMDFTFTIHIPTLVYHLGALAVACGATYGVFRLIDKIEGKK